MPPVSRKRSPRLTYVTQVRFTQDQATQLQSIAEESDDTAVTFSSLVRNIVGTWLINHQGLHGQALEDAVRELLDLEREDR